MIGNNPIYEYAALPDVKRIADEIRRTAALNAVRGEVTEASASAAPAAAAAAPASPAVATDNAHGPHNTVVAGTSDIIVRVPIMGEGLRSARVISLNKKPGDAVKHDEVLCEVETDKAVYPRSEEHTSELQSHSEISYAVFCLKKKKN